MPISLSSNEYYHPLFSLPKKKLLLLTRDWAANKLTPTQTYLLYLSLLNSTDLVIWRCQANFTPKTIQIISNNMEHLIQIIGKIDLIHHPAFTLPKFAISHDTAGLDNSFYWIQAWIHNYNEFMTDFIDASRREEIKVKVERREFSLAKLIKDQNATPAKLANNLAEWAEDACDFPTHKITHPLTHQPTTMNEFWKEIIRACVREDAVWRYSEGVFDKLIEHCEENLQNESMGTIYAHALMKLLRSGAEKRDNYTGMGDADLRGKITSFKLLDPNTSAEDANVLAIIQSSPESEPKRHQYERAFDYLKAKANWDLKVRYKKD